MYARALDYQAYTFQSDFLKHLNNNFPTNRDTSERPAETSAQEYIFDETNSILPGLFVFEPYVVCGKLFEKKRQKESHKNRPSRSGSQLDCQVVAHSDAVGKSS